MGKKRKDPIPMPGPVPGISQVVVGGQPVGKKPKEEPSLNNSVDSDVGVKLENSTDFEEEELLLPPKEDLQILLDRYQVAEVERDKTKADKLIIDKANKEENVIIKLWGLEIEQQLPRDDHVKYDSRAKKLDWEIIKFKQFSSEDCRKFWEHIQFRIRRFRIMSELIPDARQWLSQPWTNFYKSKDHNRHPEMPKKPLSMYMLYYSERREDIQRDNPALSMPDVAKICSDEYQKLSEESKQHFKDRCDNMRKEYEEKLEQFYTTYPEMRPVKQDKSAKALAYKQVVKVRTQQQNAIMQVRTSEPERPVILLPGAPQKPGKPFDLFFQNLMEELVDQTAERGVQLEKARQEWREMKVKKKAKWIRKAMQEFRSYEDRVAQFKLAHPEFNPPSVKSFLTQEEQKILDKHMGRPEKPPSSAYSLFSKEMLNNDAIKQYPSKERMSHISDAWKKVSDAEKEVYQAQVNEMMTRYKQEYNDWYEALSEDEKKAEKERTVNKNAKKNHHNHHNNSSNIVVNTAPQYITSLHPPGTSVVTSQMKNQPPPMPFISLQNMPGSNSGGPQTITVMSGAPGTTATVTGGALPPNLASAPQIQNIAVPYPGQPTQPMFVKVEVVGGPNGSHTQLIPQISIPNTATSIGGYTIGGPGGGSYTIQLPTVTQPGGQQIQYTTTSQPQLQYTTSTQPTVSGVQLQQQHQQTTHHNLPTQPLPQQTLSGSGVQQVQMSHLQPGQTLGPQHIVVTSQPQVHIQQQPGPGPAGQQTVATVNLPQIPQQMTLNSGFQQTVAGQPGQPQQLHTTAVAAMQQQQIQTAVAQQQQIKTVQQQPQQQQSWMQVNMVKAEKDRIESLKAEILRREPFEPARSHKQLFISDYVVKHRRKDKKTAESKLVAAAKDIWRETDKKDKKKWLKMLEPQRQRYIEAYTIFVRGLNKEELELYTDMKARRDAEEEARRANESEDSEESSSDDDSDSDSDTGSDSDL